MSVLEQITGHNPATTALPSHVDPTMQEAMTPAQLAHILSEVDPATLGKGMVQVGYKDVATAQFSPWNVTIAGAINIYGNTHGWEVEIDIRNIEKAEDVLTLVAGIHESFDRAAEHLAKGV